VAAEEEEGERIGAVIGITPAQCPAEGRRVEYRQWKILRVERGPEPLRGSGPLLFVPPGGRRLPGSRLLRPQQPDDVPKGTELSVGPPQRRPLHVEGELVRPLRGSQGILKGLKEIIFLASEGAEMVVRGAHLRRYYYFKVLTAEGATYFVLRVTGQGKVGDIDIYPG
jgi:hypothetical protein